MSTDTTHQELTRRDFNKRRLEAWAKRLELERRLEKLMCASADLAAPPPQEIEAAKEQIKHVEDELGEIQTEMGEENGTCPICQTKYLRFNYERGGEEEDNKAVFFSCRNDHNFVVLAAGPEGMRAGFDMLLYPEDIAEMLRAVSTKPRQVN
jgi:hypothetical protein